MGNDFPLAALLGDAHAMLRRHEAEARRMAEAIEAATYAGHPAGPEFDEGYDPFATAPPEDVAFFRSLGVPAVMDDAGAVAAYDAAPAAPLPEDRIARIVRYATRGQDTR